MRNISIRRHVLPCITIMLMVALIALTCTSPVLAKRSKVVNKGKPFYKWARGYAGFNVKDGVSMPRGGSLFWTDKGGPEVSFSFGASFPGASVGLGVASASSKQGVAVKIPANKHFYKVYVEKQVKFQKYSVYVWRYDPRVQRERWVHSSDGVKKVAVTAKRYYPKKVCPNAAHKCKKKK